jgi:hypothetical protein
MADGAMIVSSAYKRKCILLPTKHHKSVAIAPPFAQILGAGILEHIVDTDRFGTFSGEVERKGSPLECARLKCELSLDQTDADYALSSEGSFGPHPSVPFLPVNHEILYFIDRQRGFHLYVSETYFNTNYRMAECSTFDELRSFAEMAHFPRHGLIVRPYPGKIKDTIFKGIDCETLLEEAFDISLAQSPERKVWVETDMRAHFNPTRMGMISQLAVVMANRLTCLCPQCKTPGWGKIRYEHGLSCSSCNLPTKEIKTEVYGCTKCDYQEIQATQHEKAAADPAQCAFCNP